MVEPHDNVANEHICEQSVTDLCHWLSNDSAYTEVQLQRLLNEEHYLGLIELANKYWLVGHLNTRLQERDVWQYLPSELCAYLTTLNEMYMKRSTLLKQEAIDVCTLLASITPKIVLLKGATTLFNGLANPISTRYMTDLDILVPENNLDECLIALQSNGYDLDHSDLSVQTSDFHHAPPALRENGPCYVELHRRPLVNSLKYILGAEETFQSAIPLTLTPNLSALQMHPTHQIIHTIVHSELQDYGYEEAHIDLRQLLNFYLLATFFDSIICWGTVEARFRDTNQLHVLDAIFYKANQLFGFTSPIKTLSNSNEQDHFVKCLKSFYQAKPHLTKLEQANIILRGYSKATITNIYGDVGKYSVLRGRMKHLKRHLKLLLKQ
jgi:hypothetical protein